ncbi:hypothetical protein IV38_GL000075 [Lactobacillus selangorensis]|uniref:Sigma-70 family RNA polymerase sigma factor n=1 Tax=Lactobacillus selangorensis TaxID=81857 RepID=A0A0R2G1G3_9LACO|nr:hypothetical protein [Lactobacillus selangorensis]KRN29195.1 hypothetical protein IV38_GL000075 [Lactobacillus selangorensis]KRN31447.1 hypothetical protein IV40_GL001443 [Lactobacillus selangorensis]
MTSDHWEQQLIERTAQRDSEALQSLFERYLPMVRKMFWPYSLRLFDEDDWLQRARFVCYRSCCIFTPHRGSRFASFYQFNLHNELNSLVRYELAQKRLAQKQALSYEVLCEQSADGIERQIEFNAMISQCDEIRHYYVEMLSPSEQAALRVLLGEYSEAEVCARFDWTPRQLQGAMQRCRRKYRQYFNV